PQGLLDLDAALTGSPPRGRPRRTSSSTASSPASPPPKRPPPWASPSPPPNAGGPTPAPGCSASCPAAKKILPPREGVRPDFSHWREDLLSVTAGGSPAVLASTSTQGRQAGALKAGRPDRRAARGYGKEAPCTESAMTERSPAEAIFFAALELAT